MRPFQELRLWARRAPVAERAAAGVAMLIAIALLAWLVVPDPDDASTDVAAIGGPTAPGSNDATTTSTGDAAATDGGAGGGSTTGGDGTGGTGGSGGTGGAPSSQRCVSAPGDAKGITDTEVRVTVVLTQIVGPAANTLFDVPTPAAARADFEAAIAGINAEGGVACRKLVPSYVNVNPVNEPEMIQLCRDLADADVFAVVDTGSLATRPAVLACFGQQKIPYFGAFYITETSRRSFYPYQFSFYTKEQLYWATAFGLRDVGFFDPAKGFQKLGFIYRTCEQEAISAFRKWIRQAGVPDSKVVAYDVGCPAVFANEADLAQAVLTFKREGVTHVTAGNFQGDVARFTANAEQQGFRPKYGFPDEALLSIASGSRAPDPDNIANAIAITLGREAENHTPGMSPTAGTQRCNAYRAKAGLKPVYDVPANAGHACDQLWMLQAALGRAPELSSRGLVAGLQATGSIDFSFPQGPNDFTGQGVTTGGQFWRVATFSPACDCWKVIQRDFRRGLR
jgi:Periplasmic binding protein